MALIELNLNYSEVMDKNKGWFSPQNKEFFGDLSYRLFKDSEGVLFLVRKTNAWSDMFDGVKKPHYRINKINKDFTIGDLYDEEFKNLEGVKSFLK